MKNVLWGLVMLAVMTGGGSAPAQTPAKTPPTFDGNVANIAWGARIESVTGRPPESGPANSLLHDNDSGFRTSDATGPKEIVVSFFKRESALVKSVTVTSAPGPYGIQDVDDRISKTAPDAGFAQVAAGKVPPAANAFATGENTFTFTPVEARFVKVRLLRNYQPEVPKQGGFSMRRIKVFEAQAPGYVPLLTRHPEIAAPLFVAEGSAAVAAAKPPTVSGCSAETPQPMQPGTGESKDVLLVMSTYLGQQSAYIPLGVEAGRISRKYASSREDFSIFDRVDTTVMASNHVQPWMLADYDTVVMEQICATKPFAPGFMQALTSWVAAGHKLILHDSDKCAAGPDYAWLPYTFKAKIPGAMGAPGYTFRILENNWMLHNRRGRPGFVDGTAWAELKPPANELGDSNVIVDWGPGWCGQIAVRNALGAFGFAQAYAHHGRGLIIWEGLDVDMTGTTWLDVVRARQLAQGFNTDNLPCSVKVGSFAVVTEPQYLSRGVLAGRATPIRSVCCRI